MTQLTMVCGRTVKGFWIMGPTQVIGGVTSISPNWGGMLQAGACTCNS